MHIDPTRLHKVTQHAIEKVSKAQVEGTEAVQPTATAAPPQTDQIVLSQRAAEVQAAHQALANVPEVRADRVAQLKAQLEADAYKVDPDAVASKMIPD